MTEDSEEFWRSKSDADLLAAAQHLSEYPDAVGRIIRAELGRRDLPDPPFSILTCRRCGPRVYLTASQRQCGYCGSVDRG